MPLKSILADVHQDAERRAFVNLLISGSISPIAYANYLNNQYTAYLSLEEAALNIGLLDTLPGLARSASLKFDRDAVLGGNLALLDPPCESTLDYVHHISSIEGNMEKLVAHLYVRHMGDLAGGQIIATKVPGPGRSYSFTEPARLRASILSLVKDSMEEEARVCFRYIINFLEEIGRRQAMKGLNNDI